MIESIKTKLSSCFDLVENSCTFNDKQAKMLYLSSLTSQSVINELVSGFLFSKDCDRFYLFNGSITVTKDEYQAITMLLSGQCLLFTDNEILALETRQYPTRSIHEPNVEKSIRGSTDAFNENILINTALIRRRIKDENLCVELTQNGLMTRTDIVLVYMKDRVDWDVVNDFKRRLDHNKDVEICNERNLIEALYGKTYNPYPHVRYTERPDIASIHLMQSSLIVLVDNMPSAILLPSTFFEQIQQIEEYTQTPVIAFITRLVRNIGIISSLYLLPYVLMLILEDKPLFFEINTKIEPIQFAIQILFAELVIEWIRQSLIYSPAILSSIMGFIVVFVLGDFGIEIGAYTKEILIFTAMCNLGNFLTPSYEISLANKFFRIIISICTLLFKLEGFLLGITLHFLILLTTRTIKYPYLYPLIPFSFKEFKRIMFDTSIYASHKK